MKKFFVLVFCVFFFSFNLFSLDGLTKKATTKELFNELTNKRKKLEGSRIEPIYGCCLGNISEEIYDTPVNYKLEFSRFGAYAEVFGASIITSLNFEGFFLFNSDFFNTSLDHKLGFRTGLGLWYGYVKTNKLSISLPVHLVSLLGKKGHYFESGIGITYETHYAEVFLHTNSGYRYQPKKKGLFVRGNVNLMASIGSWYIRPGASIGYSF